LSRGRIVLARALTVIGLVLALVSLVAVFVRYEVFDESTFRETSEQLLQDDAVQEQLASSAVEILYENVDVQAEIEARLPEAQKGLSVAIAAAFRAAADRVAAGLFDRPRVQGLLLESLSVSHAQLVRLLEDEGRFTSTEGGVVYLDLREFVGQLADRIGLPAGVADRIPAERAQIRLIESDELETAQKVTSWLETLAAWLWVFVLVAWAVAIWLVPGRRRKEVRAIAVGILLVGLLVLIIRRAAGNYIVSELAAPSAEDAASSAYDIVTRHLRDVGWTDVMIGVVALAGVWLVGPGTRARQAVAWLAPYLRRPEYVYGGFAVAWLLLLWWRPTVQFARPLNVLVMVVVSAIGTEVLRRIALSRHPGELPPPESPPAASAPPPAA
jgi:hypothetical protein